MQQSASTLKKVQSCSTGARASGDSGEQARANQLALWQKQGRPNRVVNVRNQLQLSTLSFEKTLRRGYTGAHNSLPGVTQSQRVQLSGVESTHKSTVTPKKSFNYQPAATAPRVSRLTASNRATLQHEMRADNMNLRVRSQSMTNVAKLTDDKSPVSSKHKAISIFGNNNQYKENIENETGFVVERNHLQGKSQQGVSTTPSSQRIGSCALQPVENQELGAQKAAASGLQQREGVQWQRQEEQFNSSNIKNENEAFSALQEPVSPNNITVDDIQPIDGYSANSGGKMCVEPPLNESPNLTDKYVQPFLQEGFQNIEQQQQNEAVANFGCSEIVQEAEGRKAETKIVTEEKLLEFIKKNELSQNSVETWVSKPEDFHLLVQILLPKDAELTFGCDVTKLQSFYLAWLQISPYFGFSEKLVIINYALSKNLDERDKLLLIRTQLEEEQAAVMQQRTQELLEENRKKVVDAYGVINSQQVLEVDEELQRSACAAAANVPISSIKKVNEVEKSQPAAPAAATAGPAKESVPVVSAENRPSVSSLKRLSMGNEEENNSQLSSRRKSTLKRSKHGYIYSLGMYENELSGHKAATTCSPLISQNSKSPKSVVRKSINFNNQDIDQVPAQAQQDEQALRKLSIQQITQSIDENGAQSQIKTKVDAVTQEEPVRNKKNVKFSNEQSQSQAAAAALSQPPKLNSQSQQQQKFLQSQQQKSQDTVDEQNVRIARIIDSDFKQLGNFCIYELNASDAKKLGIESKIVVTPLRAKIESGLKELSELKDKGVEAYMPLNNNIKRQLQYHQSNQQNQ